MSQNRTILVVDDRPIGRETLEALLVTEGYHLTFANNGREALEKAMELTPDLILLDVMMPDIDGFEVCRRLRADSLLAEVPIIMVTALDDRASLLQGIEAGADDFMIKPFDRIELRARVRTIIRLNRYRRLLSERTKFEWVVEQADDGYIIINNSDNILYANPQARLYLGLLEDQSELTAETFLALAKKQYHCQPQEAWDGWPERFDRQISYYLVRPASPTAHPFWLQIDLMDMNSGMDEWYLLRLRDVTASVIEQRASWTFHRQVSHKLKTPLGHLVASFEALDEEDLSSLAPGARTFLSIARQGAVRLKDEIQDIFNYIEAPDLIRSGRNWCSLAEISALTSKIEAGFELKPVNISYQGLEDPGNSYVLLSRQVMGLILGELFENAKKFHPKQSPTIEVKISHSSHGANSTDAGFAEARIQIYDDGLTLSPVQLAKIWTPYYQAEKYFTGQVGGVGLGLAVVASLIWGVGGTCRAYNREEKPGIVVELALSLELRIKA